MPRLLRLVLQSKSMGAGVVRARPPHNYPWLRQNLVRANFAASKNKKENFKGKQTDNMLSISSYNVNILLLPLSSRLIGSICYNNFR